MKKPYEWISIASICVALAACGGGGDAPADAPSVTPQSSPQGKVAYDAYASPSGTFCTQTDLDVKLGEYCVEPTSSNARLAELSTYLLNPVEGKLVHFQTIGFGLYIDKDGRKTYKGMESRDLYVGKHKFTLEGNTYGPEDADFSGAQLGGAERNMHDMVTGGDLSRQLIFQTGYAEDFADLRRQNLTFDPQHERPQPIPNFDFWSTKIGLRTDWLDAPDETMLTYKGSVNMQGDMGGASVIDPATGRTLIIDSSVNCDVVATLDVKRGKIMVEVSACTSADVQMGATTAGFATAEWHFDVRKSVVKKGAFPTQVQLSNLDMNLHVDQAIADVTGGIYGSQARTLYIEGHGPNSAIVIIAMRTDARVPTNH
ncbi:hypothetical protein [Aquabacterium sp.]|uniref:hypothetical protein n=1 Tax=Aquabacterium sp. TaxID=1872578 RepID=UPI002487E72E|nr:hypothetical protein [Aquabacterium sp.]MDI1261206.1 hypothetical protein [Aquabacterium sp.]